MFQKPHKSQNRLNAQQGYLDAAEDGGINAHYAWRFQGGDGKGSIKFVIIEQGWIPEHEAISINVFPDTGINHHEGKDHGTATMGIIMMNNNNTSGVGIAHNGNGYVVSEWRSDGVPDLAAAIRYATRKLHYGDIILIETQVADILPPHKLWPAEVETDVFRAIMAATRKGIIVIEPAGNGSPGKKRGNNLDIYYNIEGKKMLNCNSSDFKDSGAIMVAAASAKLPHGKLTYSNYGSRVNCFAWGEKVMTAGSFPKSSYGKTNTYTDKFGGTSSAAAIVAGVVISVQSIAEQNLNKILGPKQMRDILSNDLYGTASLNGKEKDRIGVMPDLKKIIDKALNCRECSLKK